jgi:DNA-binding NarL/FixJ family response regulator
VSRIRIFVADDHELVRLALKTTIESEFDMEVVGEAADGDHAVSSIIEVQPDVVLMDLRMPGKSGIECCREVLATCSDTRIIMLTSFDEDEEVFGALNAGASGYLMKDVSPNALLDTIRNVADGHTVLDDAVARRLVESREREASDAEDGPLSPREQEVLELMARGLSNKDIARELWISEPTVKTHVGHILQKLDQRDRTQAVVEAIRRGLVDVTPEHGDPR